MKEIKNNQRRARAAIVAFCLMIIVKIITIIVSYKYAQFLKSEEYNPETVTPYFKQIMIVSSIEIILHIPVIICFIMWFHRVYLNLERLEVPLKYNSNWAILSWFIPLANFFIPFQIMQEISEKTQKKTTADYKNKNTIIFLWWILFIGLSLYQYYNVLFLDVGNDYAIIYSMTTIGLVISLIIIVKLIKDINVYEMILLNQGNEGFKELEHLVE